MTDESKLIFIISQPRSGSTLLQKLISNNNQVETVSEPWLLLPLLSIYKPSLIKAEYNYDVACHGLFDYLGKNNSKEELKVLLRELLLKLYKVSDPGNYFLDKTPRYYEMIPEIYNLFPGARYVVLKRNPFACLQSMIATWSKGELDYLKFRAYYRDFLVAPFLIQEFCENYGDKKNVITVKYEDIVLKPKENITELYAWLGLSFNETVLQVGNNEKVKGLFGDDVYKKSPLQEITPGLSNSWRSILKEKEMPRFFDEYGQFLTDAFMSKYGYEPETFSRREKYLRKSKFKLLIDLLKKSGKL